MGGAPRMTADPRVPGVPGAGSDPDHGHSWDEALRSEGRSLRSLPGALLLGPTGARLWADYVEPVPGFAGRFDFIHKANIPLLFRVCADRERHREPWRAVWYPSHLCLEHDGAFTAFREDKFITWDDCAVSVQSWTNRGTADVTLRLEVDGDASFRGWSGGLEGRLGGLAHGLDVDLVVAWDEPALLRGLRLPPGASASFVVAAAVGSGDPPEELRSRALFWAGAAAGPSGPGGVLATHRRAYTQWFGEAPRFSCDDPVLERTWAYRWFLLRHNLADPRCGLLRHPLFYEGRSHKKGKSPLRPGGWEFSKFIPLSAPMHLCDARWHSRGDAGAGVLRTARDAADEQGLICSLTVDGRLASYANFLGWAAYQWFLARPDPDLAREVLPVLQGQVRAWQAVHGNPADQLMVEQRHSRTGKEYQPSYWYFSGFPCDPKDPAGYTPLKRVDRSVYQYMNALGVARLSAWVGDLPAARAFEELAAAVAADVRAKMWDPHTRFFYDLHHETDEKAFVRNVVGFHPAWAGLCGDGCEGLCEHLLDPAAFATRCPFPSVAADSRAYAPAGGWFGRFLKGRNGCMWNGPTWPYTNAIVLDGLARESRRLGHRYDTAFGAGLRAFALLHFQGRDLSRPGLVEQYDSRTGEPLSDEQDYNHSYWIDLVVRHVVGLDLQPAHLLLDPLEVGLDHFVLDGLRLGGSALRVTWRRPGAAGAPSDLEPGYHVWEGDRCVHRAATLSPARVPRSDPW